MTSIYTLTLQEKEKEAAIKAEEKTTKEIAFRMKESGIPVADIARITKRSTETLEKWFAAAPSVMQSA